MRRRRRQAGKGTKRPSDYHGGAVEADEWERAMAVWPDQPVAEGVSYTDAAPVETHRKAGPRGRRRPAGGVK